MLKIFKQLKHYIASVGAIAFLSSPLPVVTGETIGLWNMNESSGGVVADDVSDDPIDGEASINTQIITENPMGVDFGNAREFSVEGSYVDLGEVENTKLDVSGLNEVAVEASIYLTGDSSSQAIVFDNRQVQLKVIDNKLSAFVRQANGFKGVVSKSELELNTPYFIGAYLKNNHLVITKNGFVAGNVIIEDPIHDSESGAKAYIGGTQSGMNLFGVIDNVRFSNKVNLDTVPPTIGIVSPDISVPTVNDNPDLVFELLDNEDQIDQTSIEVFVNGVLDQGLIYDEETNELSGKLEYLFKPGSVNTIEIKVKDSVGNDAISQFEIKYISRGLGQEYSNDESTLGLWHLNDLGDIWVKDASSNKKDGKVGNNINGVKGVMGGGKFFGQYSTGISLPPIPLNSNTFTFETWINPLEISNRGNIFDNNQFQVEYDKDGKVFVTFKTFTENYTYTSQSGALTLGEWSHLKVVYDGEKDTGNLLILVNGLVKSQIDAHVKYDVNDEPYLAQIGGNYFQGSLDEMRLSNNIRESANLILGHAPEVILAYPAKDMVVSSSRLSLYAVINDPARLMRGKTLVYLNGVKQGGYTVTHENITGELTSDLKLGVNELKIGVTNRLGNQTIITRKIFYIKKEVLSEYEVDENTVGLWHFNGESANDSSGNGYNFELSGNEFYDQGVLGDGVWISSKVQTPLMNFNGKSFTIEGWFKPTQLENGGSQNLWTLNGSSHDIRARYSEDGLAIYFSVPGENFSVDLPSLFKEEKFYHLAYVIDAYAEHSNFQVYVNGDLKYNRNVDIKCRACKTDIEFSLGNSSDDIGYDELRLSSDARYSFSIGSNSGTEVSFTKTSPESTVHISQPEFEIYFADEKSIEQTSMKIKVNDVLQAGFSQFVTGTIGILSGTLSSTLSPGANKIEVSSRNQEGEEFVKTFFLYYILQGPDAEYDSNEDTMGLWHFNTGNTFLDESNNELNFTGENSSNLTAGVYNEAWDVSDQYEYLTASGNSNAQSSSLTLEGWYKLAGYTSYYFYLNSQSIFNITSNGGVNINLSGYNKNLPDGTLPDDGKYHHVALILDSQNAYKQLLVVVDGVVVHSGLVTTVTDFTFNSAKLNASRIILDELRLMKTPSYTLNFNNSSSSLFRQAKKALIRNQRVSK